MMEEEAESKMRSPDRILELELIDPEKKVVNSTGIVDSRLFTGGNKLHAIQDNQTSLWYLKYEAGVLPPAFRDQRFTSFSRIIKHVSEYFQKRNLRIKEVKD